jgi:hypothetical protein
MRCCWVGRTLVCGQANNTACIHLLSQSRHPTLGPKHAEQLEVQCQGPCKCNHRWAQDALHTPSVFSDEVQRKTMMSWAQKMRDSKFLATAGELLAAVRVYEELCPKQKNLFNKARGQSNWGWWKWGGGCTHFLSIRRDCDSAGSTSPPCRNPAGCSKMCAAPAPITPSPF